MPGFMGGVRQLPDSRKPMAAKIPLAGEVDADWGLLARAAGGDGDAFTALVERHQERLIGLCSRWLGDREEARDAAQEVFLKVFRHADRVEPRGRFFTWLYRIAINHCLNQVRRRRIVRFFSFQGMGAGGDGGGRLEGTADAAFDPADGGPDAETALLSRERWRVTRERLDRLPENQRVVGRRREPLRGRRASASRGRSGDPGGARRGR